MNIKVVALIGVAGTMAACIENTSIEAPTASVTGQDYGGDVVSVSIRPRGDGKQVATLSGGLDFTCTSVFDDLPTAGGSELSTITCTDGTSGSATLRYDASAQPTQFVYSRTGGKGGSLRF